MKGYVYIMSNKSMPGIFKIGYTMKDPYLRAKELSSAGVPYKYIVNYEMLVENPERIENKIHMDLAQYRENKEWFRCDLQLCIQSAKKCSEGQIYYQNEQCFETETSTEFPNIYNYNQGTIKENYKQPEIVPSEYENTLKIFDDSDENLNLFDIDEIVQDKLLRRDDKYGCWDFMRSTLKHDFVSQLKTFLHIDYNKIIESINQKNGLSLRCLQKLGGSNIWDLMYCNFTEQPSKQQNGLAIVRKYIYKSFKNFHGWDLIPWENSAGLMNFIEANQNFLKGHVENKKWITNQFIAIDLFQV